MAGLCGFQGILKVLGSRTVELGRVKAWVGRVKVQPVRLGSYSNLGQGSGVGDPLEVRAPPKELDRELD